MLQEAARGFAGGGRHQLLTSAHFPWQQPTVTKRRKHSQTCVRKRFKTYQHGRFARVSAGGAAARRASGGKRTGRRCSDAARRPAVPVDADGAGEHCRASPVVWPGEQSL